MPWHSLAPTWNVYHNLHISCKPQFILSMIGLHFYIEINNNWGCWLTCSFEFTFLGPVSQSIQSFSHVYLWPDGLQHTRLPWSSPTPTACSSPCPLSHWFHATISPSVLPFSSCLQSFMASGSFPMSQFFTTGGQNIEDSASTSVLPKNIQDWFPLEWTGWISCSPRDFQDSSPAP